MTKSPTIKNLESEINRFVAERDWQQFHSPKNLAMALSIETAELMEIFQWLSQKQSFTLDEQTRNQVSEEIGDVMIYLTTLAAKFGIDPVDAALKKMEKNHKKYPADQVRGKSEKYTSYLYTPKD